ncbi:enoyl-CoA hydratase/isomerase family protein [Burkholderia sp. BCC1993]|uniref:enoyl-CoA hydratase/isomerase family protein n=1 Tax=Burkholderia sp. BCC1993 TaxID=2817444 RepID=UPI002AB30318|nr:enoyl-CoA hydratase/isomerase family protein [Burkholderia sp. BCC1993]
MSFTTLSYEVRNQVALITLERPAQRNAVNSAMSRELPKLWRHFAADDSALLAIVTGRGDKAFCTGADLGDLPETDGDGNDGTLQSIRWTSLQNKVWKPVIAAINGYAVGGGLHFVADSDIVLAAESATFFDTHVAVGLVAGLEPVSLCRRMPIGAVLRMALTGGNERMSARAALSVGLVDEVVPDASLLERAFALADNIKTHSPAALARTKQAIWQAQELGLHAGLENAWRLIMAHNAHPDFMEGGTAFLQRRPPQWQPYSALGGNNEGCVES